MGGYCNLSLLGVLVVSFYVSIHSVQVNELWCSFWNGVMFFMVWIDCCESSERLRPSDDYSIVYGMRL